MHDLRHDWNTGTVSAYMDEFWTLYFCFIMNLRNFENSGIFEIYGNSEFNLLMWSTDRLKITFWETKMWAHICAIFIICLWSPTIALLYTFAASIAIMLEKHYFIPALQRHRKGLKSCICYKKYYSKIALMKLWIEK